MLSVVILQYYFSGMQSVLGFQFLRISTKQNILLRLTPLMHLAKNVDLNQFFFLYLVLVWRPTCIISFGRFLFVLSFSFLLRQHNFSHWIEHVHIIWTIFVFLSSSMHMIGCQLIYTSTISLIYTSAISDMNESYKLQFGLFSMTWSFVN